MIAVLAVGSAGCATAVLGGLRQGHANYVAGMNQVSRPARQTYSSDRPLEQVFMEAAGLAAQGGAVQESDQPAGRVVALLPDAHYRVSCWVRRDTDGQALINVSLEVAGDPRELPEGARTSDKLDAWVKALGERLGDRLRPCGWIEGPPVASNAPAPVPAAAP